MKMTHLLILVAALGAAYWAGAKWPALAKKMGA